MVKLLFLPHCLKKGLIEEISKKAREKGYKIYIVPGGSKVKKIIKEYLGNKKGIKKIVGIACCDEINLAKGYLDKIGIKKEIIFYVFLSREGCKDTNVDLDKVYEVL